MTHVSRLCFLSVMLCALGAPARAQDADTRHGGWMGLGLGYGAAGFSCDTCGNKRGLNGWTFNLGFGGTLKPHRQLRGPGGFLLERAPPRQVPPTGPRAGVVADF